MFRQQHPKAQMQLRPASHNGSPVLNVTVLCLRVRGGGRRYGDELNPWGDIAMIGQAWCLSKPGALLLLAAPVGGKDVITWNQGREYGPSMFPHLVANWQQVWRSPGGAEVIQIFRSLKREITEGF